MSTITPVGNRVLVRMDSPETTHASGLIIPDNAQEKTATGVVEAVGPGAIRPKGSPSLVSIEEQGISTGDRVLLTSAYAGAETGENGFILVDLSEVLAVLS